MSTRTCINCNATLSPLARADARYCSGRCRVAAHRARASRPAIPAALTDAPRWVRHIDKRPVDVTGWPASSTNPSTWTTHAVAAQSTVGDGIGFVLNGDGIACIDLDNCISADGLSPLAQRILASLPPTYVEVSPSGTGLHIWGRAHVPHGRVLRLADGDVEVYGTGRYLTVTGNAYQGAASKLASIAQVVDALVG